MPRGIPNKKKEQLPELKKMVVRQEEVKEIAIEDMPLTTYKEYKAYNKKAKWMNKTLSIKHGEKKVYCTIKPCPIDLHPTQRVIFNRKDQPRNPLPVFLSTEMIEFKQTLIPGKTYDLPLAVLAFLSNCSTPIWEWHENPDGSKETRIASRDPRFAIRTIYEDEDA